MLRAVGERLDAVEHARGRVGRRRRAGRAPACGGSGSVSSRRRPPRVSTIRSAAVEVAPPRSSSSSGISLSSSAPRHIVEPQVRRRALDPVEVVGERERPPVVHADHLEHAVAAQQPLVGGRDGRLLGGHRPAVDARELGGGRGSGYLVGHGGLSWQAVGDGAQSRITLLG